MAQSIAGTNLAASWAASSARVATRVRVDWNRDGDYSDTCEDITSRVLSLSIQHSIYDQLAGLPVLGATAPSRASVVVSNEDRWLSPSNATGLAATYPLIAYGIYRFPIQIELGYYNGSTPERLVQFTGEIETADESESASDATVTFACTDNAIALLQYKASTTIYQDLRPDQMIQIILVAAGAATGASLDQAACVIPYAWMDDENGWEECRDLAMADGGMFYFEKDGGARFRRITAPIERADSLAPVATLNQGNARALRGALTWRDCYSRVTATFAGRYVGTLDELYKAPSAIIVPPGQTVTEECRLRYPAIDVVPPVYGTDYTAVSSSYDTVAYGASGMEIAVTEYGQRVDLAITNHLAYDTLYVCNLVLRGFPLIGDEAQEVRYDQDGSLGHVYGTKVYKIGGNPYMQTREQADRVAQYMRDRVQQPRRVYIWQGPACPWLEMLDRVTLSHNTMTPNPGIDVDCYVLGNTIRYSLGDMLMQDLTLLPVTEVYARSDYFIVGTTRYGSYGRAGY